MTAVAHLRLAVAASDELGPGIGQHRLVDVDTERAAIARFKQFQSPARAGAKIDQEIERTGAERLTHRRLDFLLGNVQRPHPVPVGGVILEELLGDGLAFPLQAFGPQLTNAISQLADLQSKLASQSSENLLDA